MKIIDRYIISFLIGPFFFGSSIVVFLFLMQFLINKLDDLVGKGLDNWIIFQLIGLNLPAMIILALPMGMLFGTLMTFGNMSASHEVTVIKASGGSLIRMMAPLIFVGVSLTFYLFWFNNVVIPESNHKAKTLLADIQRKKPTFALESGQFTSSINSYIILARQVDSVSGLMESVTIYDNKNTRIINTINADSGKINFNKDYSEMILNLYSGEIHQNDLFSAKNYKKINFDKYSINLVADGFNFERSDDGTFNKGQRELNIDELALIRDDALKNAKLIETQMNQKVTKDINKFVPDGKINNALIDSSSKLLRLERNLNYHKNEIVSQSKLREDYLKRAREYDVELQKKYALPFACLIFCFVGAPLGIITKGGNFGISAAYSILFYIIYWICLIGGEKLGDRGYLNIILSMWFGNIIVGFLGILLTLKVSFEIDINPFTFIKKIFRK